MRVSIQRYFDLRDNIASGDLLAFVGRGTVSSIIRLCAKVPTHVGIVKWTDGGRVVVSESTSLNGFSGVVERYLSDIVDTYPGEIFWVPLTDRAFLDLDQHKFFSYLSEQKGKKYDSFQAITSIMKHLWFPESFQRLFCSELVTGALEASGVIGKTNASRITPREVLHLKRKDGGPVYDLTGIIKIIRSDQSEEWDF